MALLAGVSADYYTRLEQGRPITPTAGVLDAVARALGLDDAGRRHPADLSGVPLGERRGAVRAPRVRPSLRQFLDALDGQPALVLGPRSEVVAANVPARALFVDWERAQAHERNYVRWIVTDERARALFVDWEDQARAAVESLRLEVGRTPEDRDAQALVRQLRSGSPDFERWWTGHGVHQRTHGEKRLHPPVVGDLTVRYESLQLPGDQGQTLFVSTTEAGTRSRAALERLREWAVDGLAGPLPVTAERPAAAGM